MTDDLRVDTGLVRDAGGRLQEIAADLPEPPAVHRPAGADALSAAIAAKVTEVVDPVIADMPIAKQALTRYAQKVINAADTYDTADRQIAEEILKRVGEFDEAFGSGGGGATAGASLGMGAVSQAGAAAQQGGQAGSMMQVPMQMAQQATQAPMQLASVAGAVPQAMQQGAQQALHQVSQLTETTGRRDAEAGELDATEALDSQYESAPGNDVGERMPESLASAPIESLERSGGAEPGPEIAL